jgi:hypothetical protein
VQKGLGGLLQATEEAGMRYLRVALIATLVGVSASGCRSAAELDQIPYTNETVHLVVKNESTDRMNIYAISDGVPTRVGAVSALETRGFDLQPQLFEVSNSSVEGAPIGGGGRATTGIIVVNRGQTIEFTIRQVLRMSTVSIVQ